MDRYLLLILDNLAMVGFLGTRATLYIDSIISFLSILPILSILSIIFAIRQDIKLHQFTQFSLFFLTLISLSFFAYIVHYHYGFERLVEKSNIDRTMALVILVLHAIISIITLTLWMFALIYALSDRRRRGLPGVYSLSHAKAGKRVFKGIVLTSLSSVGIYWVLFVV